MKDAALDTHSRHEKGQDGFSNQISCKEVASILAFTVPVAVLTCLLRNLFHVYF